MVINKKNLFNFLKKFCVACVYSYKFIYYSEGNDDYNMCMYLYTYYTLLKKKT